MSLGFRVRFRDVTWAGIQDLWTILGYQVLVNISMMRIRAYPGLMFWIYTVYTHKNRFIYIYILIIVVDSNRQDWVKI